MEWPVWHDEPACSPTIPDAFNKIYVWPRTKEKPDCGIHNRVIFLRHRINLLIRLIDCAILFPGNAGPPLELQPGLSAQHCRLVGALPANAQVVAPKVAILGNLLVDRLAQ